MHNSNRHLILLAGGQSSRLKKSLKKEKLSEQVRKIASTQHKALVPIGNKKRPMLYYQLMQAVEAGVTHLTLISGTENQGFQDFFAQGLGQEFSSQMQIRYVLQEIPPGKSKPLGTADALQQALEKQPNLLHSDFIVLNGDNLYSAQALHQLYTLKKGRFGAIGYVASTLKYPEERLAQFAVMQTDASGYLVRLHEKPSLEQLQELLSHTGRQFISMNIFKLNGEAIWPYLKRCPFSDRGEKELPQAVQLWVKDNPQALRVLERKENVPDLTTANDLESLTALER